MNLPLISLDGLYIKLSFVISLIIISLAFLYVCKKKGKHLANNNSPMTIALSTVFIFSIHLISYKIFYNFYTNIVGIIMLTMLIGVSYSIISMSIIIFAETIFLSNGSVQMLGINIIAIVFLGSIMSLLTKNKKNYFMLRNIEKDKINRKTIFNFHIIIIYAFLSLNIIWIFFATFISYTNNISPRLIILETIETQLPFAIAESIVTLIFLIIFYLVKQKNINNFLLYSILILTSISLVLKTTPDIAIAFLEAYDVSYNTTKPILNINIPRFIYVLLAEISIFSITYFLAYISKNTKKII